MPSRVGGAFSPLLLFLFGASHGVAQKEEEKMVVGMARFLYSLSFFPYLSFVCGFILQD